MPLPLHQGVFAQSAGTVQPLPAVHINDIGLLTLQDGQIDAMSCYHGPRGCLFSFALVSVSLDGGELSQVGGNHKHATLHTALTETLEIKETMT